MFDEVLCPEILFTAMTELELFRYYIIYITLVLEIKITVKTHMHRGRLLVLILEQYDSEFIIYKDIS